MEAMEFVNLKFKTKYPPNMVAKTVKDAIKRELRVSKMMTKGYKKKLKEFESKYDKSSKKFYSEFEKGKLGDKQDYFEWFAYIQYHKDREQRYKILQGAVSD
ncbi:MAG: hypothetical protein U9M95_04640 [Candidatus Altiarchaeota archaeon]|nr:hypothetical protein [Candidatus Altiarchaeota archaeon]